jgi:hypothetical protein
MIFFCVACLRPSKTRQGTFGREGANCFFCNATSRDRAMLLNIHWAFISKFIKNPRHVPKIIGVSDGQLMEKILKKLYGSNYANYHYHQDPLLDITQVPSDLYGSADIVSCTEVLEHVAPPVSLAFSGLRKILKEHGKLILSVPHSDSFGKHIEHFPEMTNTELLLGDNPKLIGTLKEGEQTEFTDLVFHGGVGFTLEYRIFSYHSLREQLLDAGFTRFKLNRNFKVLGIAWEKWSRVWVNW